MENLQNIDFKKYVLTFSGLALGLYTLLNVDVLLEIVGIFYIAKFAYNNLLFKAKRDEFIGDLLGKLEDK